jgi:macrophage erythroblast attacher
MVDIFLISTQSLELELRLQEFVLLVSKGAYPEAIRYSQNQLAPIALESPAGLSRVKHGMAILAFAADPHSELSLEFRGSMRWQYLKDAFNDAFQQLYGMSSMPPLSLSIEIGLSAMKMPSCGHADTSASDCPVCSTIGSSLAISLPLAQIGHSTLVCPITKRLMDEDNYPLVLPNGFVYSRQALEEMAVRDQGVVFCPRSGDQYPFASLKRAYIL